jgi:hypothetical protein
MRNASHTGPDLQQLDHEKLAEQYPVACSLDGDDGAGVVLIRLDHNPMPWSEANLNFLAAAFQQRVSFLLLGKDRATVEAVAASLMFMARPAGGHA